MNDLILHTGQHLLAAPVLDWEVSRLDQTGQTVILTASIQSHPMRPISQSMGRTATSVAVQMDKEVAIALYRKLGALGRSMGWLP